MLIKRLFLFTFIIASLFLLPSDRAEAAKPQVTMTNTPNSLALTAIPPRLGDEYGLLINPGETLETSLEIYNPNSTPLTTESFLRDFYLAEDGQTPIPIEDGSQSAWQLSSWTTLSPANNVIAPKSSTQIKVKISAPADAKPGGRYGMILTQPVINAQTPDGSGAQINTRVGVLLYVVVNGELSSRATLSNLSIKPLNSQPLLPLKFNIHNHSSFHLRPKMQLEISNLWGKVIHTQEIEKQNIFPDTKREFSEQIKLPAYSWGIFKAKLSGNYGLPHRDNSDLHQLSAKTTFAVFPLLMIEIVTGVIVVAAIVIFISKKHFAHQLKNERERARALNRQLQKAHQQLRRKRR